VRKVDSTEYKSSSIQSYSELCPNGVTVHGSSELQGAFIMVHTRIGKYHRARVQFSLRSVLMRPSLSDVEHDTGGEH